MAGIAPAHPLSTVQRGQRLRLRKHLPQAASPATLAPMRRIFVLAMPLLLAASVAFAGPTEKKKGGGATFIQLPSLTATMFRSDGGRGVLTIDAGLDIPDAGLRQRANASVPLLRDAYTRQLLAYAPFIPPGAPPNPDIIGTQLQRATDQVLGRPGAKLLLGTILEN